MYDYIRHDIFYIMLYAATTTIALLAGCYLLFRRGNAFASDIKPPERIRRWTALFFAVYALEHIWYMPILFVDSEESIIMIDVVGCLLDSLTVFPIAIIVMLVMLQDRRRPFWPIVVIMIPIVLVNIASVVAHGYVFLTQLHIYFLLICIGLFVYMLISLRHYGRWLRDNYADLEHKEVWQSLVVLAIILVEFAIYPFTTRDPFYQYALLVVSAVLICYLLWRVETLSDLSMATAETATTEAEDEKDYGPSQSTLESIGTLLQQYCIDTQLFLQHDLTLHQLAKAVGTNRFYLSQYFSIQGQTYNGYINDLRVTHFVSLYQEAVASQRSFTAQKLAQESGFRNYNTFSSAFKRKTGLSVTAWMKEQEALSTK